MSDFESYWRSMAWSSMPRTTVSIGAKAMCEHAWFDGYKAGSEFVMSCLDRQLSSSSNSDGEHPINDAATRTRKEAS